MDSASLYMCVEGYWGRGAPATDGCVWEDSNRLPQKLDYVLLLKKKGKERKKKRNNKIKTRLGTLSLSDIRGEISSAPVLLILLLLFCLAWSLIMNSIMVLFFFWGVMTASCRTMPHILIQMARKVEKRPAFLFPDMSLEIAGNYCSADLQTFPISWTKRVVHVGHYCILQLDYLTNGRRG